MAWRNADTEGHGNVVKLNPENESLAAGVRGSQLRFRLF